MDQLFARLTGRDARRTEAEIQADVRQFILSAPFELDEGDITIVSLESPVGNRQRIDVEVGATVIEVKRDLRRERVREDAVEQLAGYLRQRQTETGLRYAGILTDGVQWSCYQLIGEAPDEVSTIQLTSSRDELAKLVVWLEGVLATAQHVPATAENIEARLGATSAAYALDRATIAALFATNRENPSVQVKRRLWSRLLTSALGTQFDDSDDLFIEHTLLVNTAEIIAHAVLGLPIEGQSAVSILNGHRFDESGVYGVVEADFFDWVIEVEDGANFVTTLAKRLSRFDWARVDQDVLKVLYESVIGADTRKRLGEYYTPDWLAEAVVANAIRNPLATRVLDPACGSGTFLFHAVRHYLRAAITTGMSVEAALNGVTQHVVGMDLHPVAVTFARVTYLLAIGRDLLTHSDRGAIHVPVYLGDAIQWDDQGRDLWAANDLLVRVEDSRELVGSELRFPDALLEDAANFDQLVTELANRASQRQPGAPIPSLASIYRRLAIPEEHRRTIDITFATMCRLHDEGRDHIWGYFVRNLARPVWLSRTSNRVDALIGNPPWLAYRHMTAEMQSGFRTMSEELGLWSGAEIATHQDLSALFVARSISQYLRPGGTFAVVMPNAVVDRSHYSGFRQGIFGDHTVGIKVSFDEPWDLRRLRPHFFPRAASVIFGTRSTSAGGMPERAMLWTGRIPRQNASWAEAEPTISRVSGAVRRMENGDVSPYADDFTQGAVLLPRVLFYVTQQSGGALGLPAGRVSVQSSRSANEKAPWKKVSDLRGVVESQYVRPVFNGESILPYRATAPDLAVVPIGTSSVMAEEDIQLEAGLDQWWRQANALWTSHSGGRLSSLREQIDFQAKLTRQLPVPPLRLVYNRSGMHVVAAKVRDRRALIASGLYWCSLRSEQEGSYLLAILNAAVTTELARPYMTYGKDERDIAKHIWQLPIPRFDPERVDHVRLAELGGWAERLAAGFAVDPDLHFAATRRHFRNAIQRTTEGEEIEALVFELLA